MKRSALVVLLVALAAFVVMGCVAQTTPNNNAVITLEPSGTGAINDSTPAPTVTPPEITPTPSPKRENLSDDVLNWGQGLNFNERNQPISCIQYKEKYGGFGAMFIGNDDPDKKLLFLTFDSGYEAGYTDSILDTLKQKNVRAVFFITYTFASQNIELVQRMIDEGHIVGNHSTTHKNYTEMSIDDARADLLNMDAFMRTQFDYAPKYFRFPGGSFSERVLDMVQGEGYTSVFWSYAYMDYDLNNTMGKDAALEKVSARLHDGGIYLFHLTNPDNDALLPELIDIARANGFAFGGGDDF